MFDPNESTTQEEYDFLNEVLPDEKPVLQLTVILANAVETVEFKVYADVVKVVSRDRYAVWGKQRTLRRESARVEYRKLVLNGYAKW